MKIKKVETENYFEIAKELYVVNLQRKALDKKEKELKEKLTVGLKKQPTDVKHNAYLAFTTADGKTAYAKYEARQSVCLNTERAKEFFSAKGLLEKVYKSVESFYFDEGEIEALVANEAISFTDLENISDKNISYAVKFVAKKDEVE
jgi:hypothetical protein